MSVMDIVTYWSGGSLTYKSLHQWVRRNSNIPKKCKLCKQSKKLDAANISQEYKRDIKDYEWLCRSCHMRKDGRLKELQINHAKKLTPTFCKYGHRAVTKSGLCMKMYNCDRRHLACTRCQ